MEECSVVLVYYAVLLHVLSIRFFCVSGCIHTSDCVVIVFIRDCAEVIF